MQEGFLCSLQMALKCADICNPCREWSICCSWANLVCEEFFRQGDRERRAALPSIPMFDRYSTTKPKVQTGERLNKTFLKIVGIA